MRKLLIGIVFIIALSTVFLHSQDLYYDTPQTVVWDAVAEIDGYQIAACEWEENPAEGILLGDVPVGTTNYFIDFGVLDIYGYYEIAIRSFRIDTRPDDTEVTRYSIWGRTSRMGDCLTGETFVLVNTPAPVYPQGIRVE